VRDGRGTADGSEEWIFVEIEDRAIMGDPSVSSLTGLVIPFLYQPTDKSVGYYRMSRTGQANCDHGNHFETFQSSANPGIEMIIEQPNMIVTCEIRQPKS
jgi:hypothetical protein